MTKIKFVCPDCGSDDVVMTDVIGLWNVDTQQWEASYDAAVPYCENCYSEHYDLVETSETEAST